MEFLFVIDIFLICKFSVVRFAKNEFKTCTLFVLKITDLLLIRILDRLEGLVDGHLKGILLNMRMRLENVCLICF